MKNLEYSIEIAASPKKVWDSMIDPETYKEWVNVSWPGSIYEGNWGKNEDIRFVSPQGGGTLAHIDDFNPYKHISAKHIAVINADGSEDRDSEVAKNWIGTTEAYTFTDKKGKTELKAELSTNPEWAKMFDDGWPKALAKLKEICER